MTAKAAAPRTPAQTLSPTVDALRRELDSRRPADGDRMQEIARYALLAPGKLLRPVLLVAAAEATGGSRDQVVPAALAVEYLHVASLVHDDVIDGDDLRRGQDSVHARYGVPDAIATGDALLFQVFSAVSECAALGVPDAAVLAAVGVLAQAGEELCRGQLQEALLTAAGPRGCGLDAYQEMASLKTGALLRGACRAGALLSGGTPEETEAVTAFGGTWVSPSRCTTTSCPISRTKRSPANPARATPATCGRPSRYCSPTAPAPRPTGAAWNGSCAAA